MASPTDAEAAGKERGKWSHKCDYLLTMTGYAVGLSNVWRFPYLCYIHGGGAFLVPYLLMLVLVGFPLFFLETSVGQFSSCSCITVFSVCPAFKGLGMASVAVNMVTLTYYTVLVSFPVLFLAYSFTWDLPWDSCENSWNSANCTIGRPSEGANMGGGVSSAEEFFHKKVLHISSGLDDISRVQWQIVAVTFLTTAFLFFCVFKGVRVMGKVVWFTAPFPFAMLLVLLARGISLPGAVDGIRFYIYPEFERLKEMKVWAAAAMQIFYSLGPGWGSLISFGSYNMFHNRSTRDAVTVPVLNCTASILAGFVVFSVLGFMAKRAGVSVEDLTVAGPSLVFIVYPEAVSMMPVAPLWSVIFFLMLFFLGVDSCFAYLETSVICLLDEFPKLRERRGWVTFVICLISFSVTILFATDAGMYWITLMDWYCASFAVIVVCFCQICIFSYIYGAGRIIQDFQLMTKRPISYVWWVIWLAVTPPVLLCILANTVLSLSGAEYQGQTFPTWAQDVGWVMAFSYIPPIPAYFLYYFCCRTAGSFTQRIAACLSPSPAWGPAEERHRQEWTQHRLKHPLRHRLLHPGLCAAEPSTSPDELLNAI